MQESDSMQMELSIKINELELFREKHEECEISIKALETELLRKDKFIKDILASSILQNHKNDSEDRIQNYGK